MIKKINNYSMIVFLSMLPMAAQAHGNVHDEKGDKKQARIKIEQKNWGQQGIETEVSRTINVEMLDTMRFSPDIIDIKKDETIRFNIKNSGKLMHEFVIGTKAENDQHATLMLKFPNMEHSEPYMTHVPSGKSGEIVWKFNRAGEFNFACLIAGHHQAGMSGTIKVAEPANNNAKAEGVVNQQETKVAPVLQNSLEGMTVGEIKKIDLSTKKITLKHEEIKSLDMPPMTMVFRVTNTDLLSAVKAGDKINFKAIKDESGTYVVTDVKLIK